MEAKLTEDDYIKAYDIAFKAHKGQTRWNGEPYITHPTNVAKEINHLKLKIIAILHDVLEDTTVTLKELQQRFPEDITMPLQLLTHEKSESYAQYIHKIKFKNLGRPSWNGLAEIVKIFDLMDNLKDLKQKQRRGKYELALLYLRR
ncbi:hypothetical protein LCGC14_2348770 [marine sediment metagenome]|uniref:HD domain-containing protein n=1 Tax=marine sediment metagenome TaxID=412755 RepID=A0A0F9CAJ7_9ZZZZ